MGSAKDARAVSTASSSTQENPRHGNSKYLGVGFFTLKASRADFRSKRRILRPTKFWFFLSASLAMASTTPLKSLSIWLWFKCKSESSPGCSANISTPSLWVSQVHESMSICLLQMSCSLGPWRWNALDSSKRSLMQCQKKQTRDHVQLGPKVELSNIPFFSCFQSTSHDVATTRSFCMLKYSSAARTSAPSAVWFTASIDWESMAIEVPVESWDLSCEISEVTVCYDSFSDFADSFNFINPPTQPMLP